MFQLKYSFCYFSSQNGGYSLMDMVWVLVFPIRSLCSVRRGCPDPDGTKCRTGSGSGRVTTVKQRDPDPGPEMIFCYNQDLDAYYS